MHDIFYWFNIPAYKFDAIIITNIDRTGGQLSFAQCVFQSESQSIIRADIVDENWSLKVANISS